jgi:hypothetical protein
LAGILFIFCPRHALNITRIHVKNEEKPKVRQNAVDPFPPPAPEISDAMELGPGVPAQSDSEHANERNREWLLKNSRFGKIAGIWAIENVSQNGDCRS